MMTTRRDGKTMTWGEDCVLRTVTDHPGHTTDELHQWLAATKPEMRKAVRSLLRSGDVRKDADGKLWGVTKPAPPT